MSDLYSLKTLDLARLIDKYSFDPANPGEQMRFARLAFPTLELTAVSSPRFAQWHARASVVASPGLFDAVIFGHFGPIQVPFGGALIKIRAGTNVTVRYTPGTPVPYPGFTQNAVIFRTSDGTTIWDDQTDASPLSDAAVLEGTFAAAAPASSRQVQLGNLEEFELPTNTTLEVRAAGVGVALNVDFVWRVYPG